MIVNIVGRMAAAVAQTGVSLGRQLFFFLFLLVPGYFAVRAYYWANVALENDGRVNRLVSMAVGGFLSLAAVALWRELVPTVRFAPLAFLSPEWFVVDRELAVQTISRLSVLESVNLIASQVVVAVLGGYACGLAKRRLFEGRRGGSRRTRPWERLVDSLGPGDTVELLTTDGSRVVGEVAAFDSRPGDDDILLGNVRRSDRAPDLRRPRGSGLTRVSRENVARLSVRRPSGDDEESGA